MQNPIKPILNEFSAECLNKGGLLQIMPIPHTREPEAQTVLLAHLPVAI